MIRTILFCLLLVGCSVDPDRIKFSPEVEKITTQMSENVFEERALCLRYRMRGETIYIYDYYIPKTLATGTSHVIAIPCNKEYRISWHTHPRAGMLKEGVQSYYHRATGQTLQFQHQMVYLSRPDILHALKSRPDYMIVQTSRHYYAWWHIDQLEEKIIQLPITGQKSWNQ